MPVMIFANLVKHHVQIKAFFSISKKVLINTIFFVSDPYEHCTRTRALLSFEHCNARTV